MITYNVYDFRIENRMLEIKRIKEGKFSIVYCPRQRSEIACGDWCPLFGGLQGNNIRICEANISRTAG